ncbi:hypothetical protein ACFV4K_32135 [Nocardia sp. NPDC059764]|uniref:hypothetical protein n=1 Tax=Nocardia sp. NPDC059764 TaxID=3346939 RepID=UPI0036500ED0
MAVRQSIGKMLVQSFGIATVLVAVMAAAPAAHAGAIFPVPDPDGFYYAAGNLDAAQNGDVLNSRQVPAHPFPGATVWQILFRSTNSTGAPIAAVTTLISPGPGPRPLLSYQPFVKVAAGMEREYPGEMQLDSSLTPYGYWMRDRIANSCVDDIISVGANHSIGEVFTRGQENDPALIRTMHENALEIVPELIRQPLYEWHGGNDQVPLDLAPPSNCR